jgi:hypothetical protein
VSPRRLLVAWSALVSALVALAIACRSVPPPVAPSPTLAPSRRLALPSPTPLVARQRAVPPRSTLSTEPCRLSGVVYDRDGEPVAGVRVIADALPDPAAPDDAETDQDAGTTSDGDGAFTLELPPGDWALTARDDDAVSETLLPIVLAPGEQLARIDLHLGDGVTLRGRVRAETDEETPMLCVRTAPRGSECLREVVADDDGAFTLPALPARPLWIEASTGSARGMTAVTSP